MFIRHSLPDLGRDLAESALLIARGPCVCVWFVSACFSGDRPSPATSDDGRRTQRMHEDEGGGVLLVNNGNAASYQRAVQQWY